MIYEKKKTKNIAFPIGGIGTGSISLAGNGELNDWEIFNRPNKNTRNGYSHFAIKAVQKGKTVAKVLHGDTNENLTGIHHENICVGFGFGPKMNTLAGFPHFKNVRFNATFPIAELTFSDPTFPAVVRLNAFNPFIPHDEFNSSLPAAFFEWEIENITGDDIDYTLAFTVQNPAERTLNRAFTNQNTKGIFFSAAEKQTSDIGYSDLCIVTDAADANATEYWYRGTWQDANTTFWRNFTERDRQHPRSYDDAGRYDHGSMFAYVTIPAGQKKKVRFVLAWNVPVQYNYWASYKDENGKEITWKNYYATQFESSKNTAEYALEKFGEFYEKTCLFTRALKESTLPAPVLDAVSANLSVLKSPTVMRYEDGSFWAWEGCDEVVGSCEGSCQHVWNYAYAMPFLFPNLERSLRETTMKYALYENGGTTFRVPLPLGRSYGEGLRSCVDGQMGEVIKCYREWKISGDDEWLKTYADKIFKMLEFAWSEENFDQWDRDCDGVMEGRQHHTLDMELFGPSSWLEGFYLLALDCGAKIADAVRDKARAEKYRELYANGKKWTNENLFNGKYFMQKVDLSDKSVIEKFNADAYWNAEAEQIKYQVADGCIIDQMLADWHAAILGLDGVFDTDKKRTALKNLYKNNFKKSMREVANMWRNFSVNDEGGTVICSYPEGVEQPAIPISYCEETMTGFEYALAGLMIAQGYQKEGERMVRAIRERYDGEKRNPWNEIECGSHYARSMASYALLPIYSGFTFDMTESYIGFAPIVKGDSRFLWSVGNTWGTVKFESKNRELLVLGNSLALRSFGLSKGENVTSVKVDGKPVSFKNVNGAVEFEQVEIHERLEIEVA